MTRWGGGNRNVLNTNNGTLRALNFLFIYFFLNHDKLTFCFGILCLRARVGRRRLSVVDRGGPVEVSPAASPSTVPGAPHTGRPDHLRPVHMGPTTSSGRR